MAVVLGSMDIGGYGTYNKKNDAPGVKPEAPFIRG